MVRLISRIWDMATPDEPSNWYLVSIMGIAVCTFAVALTIGAIV